MANHVNTHVRFEKINEAGLAKLQEFYSRIRTDEKSYEWFSDIWGLDREITDKYDWNLENVGPKWCYFEDRGEDYFSTVSAWSYPEQGLIWLIKEIAQVDPDVLAYVTYEDEMPNFFGCWFINKDGLYDGCEWDDEEITEALKEAVPELAELNEETDSDQYWELWNENIWDMIADKQYEVYRSIKESLESE